MTPPAVAAPSAPTCPDGHGPMILKRGRTGEFYSCSQYPACRRSAPVPLDLPCPLSGAAGGARGEEEREAVHRLLAVSGMRVRGVG